MQAHNWRCKADSHRYPWLGTASSPVLYMLTVGPILDAGCCKNRDLILQGNPLIFLSHYNGRYSEANSIFVSADPSMKMSEVMTRTQHFSEVPAHMLHTQYFTHSDYFQSLQASVRHCNKTEFSRERQQAKCSGSTLIKTFKK